MPFREDQDALRHRVDALEEQLAQARAENDSLRNEQEAAAEATSVPRDRGARERREPGRPPTRAWAVLAVVLGLAGAAWLGLGAHGDPPSSASRPASTALDPRLGAADTLPVGASVWVESGGTWYPASVIGVRDDESLRVHYTGDGPESDETVPLRRVRVP